MGVGHLGGGLDLLGGRAAVLAELDVFGDRAAKEDGLLADDTDLLTEPADVEVLDVVPVELDRALGRVVESLEEADSGRLACLLKLEEKEKQQQQHYFSVLENSTAARGTDKGERLAGGDRDGEALEDGHLGALGVVEEDTLE